MGFAMHRSASASAPVGCILMTTRWSPRKYRVSPAAGYTTRLVLYEEGLDEEVLSGAVNAIRHADTLIIGGTSLVVYPAAGLIRYFRGDHLVVINMQPTGADAEADLCIAKPIGQVLSEDVTLDL